MQITSFAAKFPTVKGKCGHIYQNKEIYIMVTKNFIKLLALDVNNSSWASALLNGYRIFVVPPFPLMSFNIERFYWATIKRVDTAEKANLLSCSDNVDGKG